MVSLIRAGLSQTGEGWWSQFGLTTSVPNGKTGTGSVMTSESAVGRNKQESKHKHKNRMHFQSETEMLKQTCDWKGGLSSQLVFSTLNMHRSLLFVNAFPVFSSQPRTPPP